jgi:dihydroneopterin aldolase
LDIGIEILVETQNTTKTAAAPMMIGVATIEFLVSSKIEADCSSDKPESMRNDTIVVWVTYDEAAKAITKITEKVRTSLGRIFI